MKGNVGNLARVSEKDNDPENPPPVREQRKSLGVFKVLSGFSSRFPSCHFGKLYGVVMALSALFSLMQYPCFAMVKGLLDGDALYVSTRSMLENQARPLGTAVHLFLLSSFQVNIGLTLLSLVAFIHPFSVYLHCRRAAKERAAS